MYASVCKYMCTCVDRWVHLYVQVGAPMCKSLCAPVCAPRHVEGRECSDYS